MREVLARHRARPDETWTIRASNAGLELEHGGRSYVVPAGELPPRAMLADGVLIKGMLTVGLAPGRPREAFALDDAAMTELVRGLGPEVAARWLLGQRLRFMVTLGLAFLLASLPIAGDPESGAEGAEADWYEAGLGVGLFVLAAAVRWRPRAWLFVVEAVWFFVLALKGAVAVATGTQSAGWLVLYATVATMGVTSLRLYRRLRAAAAPA